MSELGFPPHLAHDCTQKNNNVDHDNNSHIVSFVLSAV